MSLARRSDSTLGNFGVAEIDLGQIAQESPKALNASATISSISFAGQPHEIRAASRLNAAHVPDAEYESLMKERDRLVGKLLDEDISPTERKRLNYVRWTINTIEDARNGHILDALEHSVRKYEAFRDDLRSLQAQLESFRTRSR